MKRTQWTYQTIRFLIANFAILATIGYAAYVIYRQQIAQVAPDTGDLLTAILTVLGLLAISEIIERYHRLNSIYNSNQRILKLLEGRVTDRPSARAFFNKLPSLDSYILAANQIDLCGVSLTATVNKQFSNFRDRLKEGANIRILIANPDSLALSMSATRSGSPEDTEYFHKRLETTFNDLAYIMKGLREHQEGNSAKKGNLSVRLMGFSPSFGILSFDANRANGIVFVELYPHYSFGTQPTFDLTIQRDGEWYKFFIEQFEQMWANAKPWEPASLPK